jgi:hypothetical protein
MPISQKPVTRETILNEVKRIVFAMLGQIPAEVYLFGSWARQEERRTSDIDIAIGCEDSSASERLMSIRTALEESTIPYRVDVIDLTSVARVFADKIRKEGIPWHDSKNVSH